MHTSIKKCSAYRNVFICLGKAVIYRCVADGEETGSSVSHASARKNKSVDKAEVLSMHEQKQLAKQSMHEAKPAQAQRPGSAEKRQLRQRRQSLESAKESAKECAAEIIGRRTSDPMLIERRDPPGGTMTGHWDEQPTLEELVLERWWPDEPRKKLLGEHLYARVSKLQPQLTGQIMGMLLQLDSSELMHLINDSAALDAKVLQAVDTLQALATSQIWPRRGVNGSPIVDSIGGLDPGCTCDGSVVACPSCASRIDAERTARRRRNGGAA